MVNVWVTQNMLELARLWGLQQFVFVSFSSVYGVNPHVLWWEDGPLPLLLPISPYATSKVAGVLLGHVYSQPLRHPIPSAVILHSLRPLAKVGFHNPQVRLADATGRSSDYTSPYSDGLTWRDYTYVDDVIEGVRRPIDYKVTPYEVINLGNNQTVELLDMARELGEALRVQARLGHLPLQLGDGPRPEPTWGRPSGSWDTAKDNSLGWAR